MQPKVSVVIPIYNVKEYIQACLDSVEKQTLKEIEVILVNDGSTDGSDVIANEYVNRNENFYLINRKNGGLSAARNTGIRRATGKYIYFLDSDDYLLENALEILYDESEKKHLEVLKFCAYSFEDGRDESMSWSDYKYAGSYEEVYTGVELLQKMKENRDWDFLSACLMFIRRDLIENNNLLFYEGIIHEDNLFHWMLLVNSSRTSVLNQPLYCRRYRSGSIMTTPNYYNRWRGMTISAYECNRYFMNHTELRKTGVDFFYFLMLCTGINDGYLKMDSKMRHQKSVRELHRKEVEVLRDIHYGGSVKMFLYAIHPALLKFYNMVKTK